MAGKRKGTPPSFGGTKSGSSAPSNSCPNCGAMKTSGHKC